MLPSNEDVRRFLTGLGTDGPEVVASMELLGARDKPGITLRDDGDVPVTRNCAFAEALKVRFPELGDDDRWSVSSLYVRFDDESGMRLVGLGAPVRGVMLTLDGERARLARGTALVPTYPKLMAPRKEAS